MPKRILFQLGKNAFVEHLGRELTVIKPKQYFIEDTTKPYHTQHGVISKAQLSKDSGTSFKSRGKDFTIIDAGFIDLYMHISRGAQIIPIKDIGNIIASTGVNGDSRVVDAGAGSGALAIMLGHIAKEVFTYEIRDDFYEIVKSNIKQLGIKNVKLKKGDVYKNIEETDIDLVTFDLPEPWLALGNAHKALKVGGFLVVYNPSVPQISDFVTEVSRRPEFVMVKTVELIERKWEFKDRKIRPKSQGLGHSGFLCYCRKIR